MFKINLEVRGTRENINEVKKSGWLVINTKNEKSIFSKLRHAPTVREVSGMLVFQFESKNPTSDLLRFASYNPELAIVVSFQNEEGVMGTVVIREGGRNVVASVTGALMHDLQVDAFPDDVFDEEFVDVSEHVIEAHEFEHYLTALGATGLAPIRIGPSRKV